MGNKITRELTCIVCPRGCALTVTLEDGAVTSVVGNACKRGKDYAVSECTHPVRTVTTTVFTEDGGVIPVKTSKAIPKELMVEVMHAINLVRAPQNAAVGDVLIADILGTGADLVVTGKRS